MLYFLEKPIIKTYVFAILSLTYVFSYAQKEKKESSYQGLVLKLDSNWSMKFSGLVNTFYTHMEQAQNGSTPAKTYDNIQNGINGALLVINPTYTHGNTTVTANFMISMGINSHGLYGNQNISGFKFSSVDVRRASATVSNTKWGSVTFGRDFGLVGLDAILQDVTFLGVGSNWNFANPSYVTLAGIGYGYMFVDKFAQVTYTSPKLFKALDVSLGVYQPYRFDFTNVNKSGDPENPNGLGVHGKINYVKSITNKVELHLSTSFSTQNISEYINLVTKTLTNNNFRGFGFDLFANLKVHNFTITGYYYNGNGMGSDGFMFRPIVEISPTNIQKVKSNSYYGQVTYKTNGAKPWTFGIIYGSSITGDAISGSSLVNETDSRRFSGVVGYQITPYIALRGEYTSQNKGLFAPAPHYNIFVLGGTFYF